MFTGENIKMISFTSSLYEKVMSPETSKALFKSSIVLISLYLVSIIHSVNYITPIETSSYEMKYLVEKEENKEYDKFEAMKCKLTMKYYKECKLAVYKHNIAKNAVKATLAFQYLLKGLTGLFLILSVGGFLFSLTIKNEKT